jgi:hypothetical protein
MNATQGFLTDAMIDPTLSFKTINFAYAIIAGRNETYELMHGRIFNDISRGHKLSPRHRIFRDLWDFEPGVHWFCELLFNTKPKATHE